MYSKCHVYRLTNRLKQEFSFKGTVLFIFCVMSLVGRNIETYSDFHFYYITISRRKYFVLIPIHIIKRMDCSLG
jgi:hypothetical protein